MLKSRPPAQITDESVGAPFWLDLAELFFLDFEPDESDFENLAERLQRSGISRNLALKILTEEVAPVAGVNLGFGLYPTIGEWSGFGPGLREGIAVSVGSPFRQVLVMSRIGIWLHRLFFRNLVEILGWSRLERHLEQGGS